MVEDGSASWYTHEPAQWPLLDDRMYNAGVLWLDLGKMRHVKFWDQVVKSSLEYYKQKQYLARNGEQSMLNNFISSNPVSFYR